MTPAALTDAPTWVDEIGAKVQDLMDQSEQLGYLRGYKAALARAPAVPREPTQAMIDAGIIIMSVTGGTLDADIRAMFRAMYDAAPAQDQPERHLTRDEQQTLGSALRDSARRLSPEVEAAIPENRAELYEPAPAPVVDELVQRLRNLDYGAGLAHEAADAIAALRAENARLARDYETARDAHDRRMADVARLAREHIEWVRDHQADTDAAWRTTRKAEARADRLAAALRKLCEAISRVCTATDGIGVINAVAELRPLLPETRGIIYDYERDALAGEDGK